MDPIFWLRSQRLLLGTLADEMELWEEPNNAKLDLGRTPWLGSPCSTEAGPFLLPTSFCTFS